MGIIVVPVSVHASQIKSNFLLNAKGMSGAVQLLLRLPVLCNNLKTNQQMAAWHGMVAGSVPENTRSHQEEGFAMESGTR